MVTTKQKCGIEIQNVKKGETEKLITENHQYTNIKRMSENQEH